MGRVIFIVFFLVFSFEIYQLYKNFGYRNACRFNYRTLEFYEIILKNILSDIILIFLIPFSLIFPTISYELTVKETIQFSDWIIFCLFYIPKTFILHLLHILNI